MAFFPVKPKPNTFMSVLEWLEAKAPDNAYIYDSVELLNTLNIPIRDALIQRGMYVRIPTLPTVSVVVNKVSKKTLTTRTKPTKVRTVVGISVAESKEHHKMSY